MQSDPNVLFMVARTHTADREREAQSVRLADLAMARSFAPRVSLRGRLAVTLRQAADWLQPAVSDASAYGYR